MGPKSFPEDCELAPGSLAASLSFRGLGKIPTG